MIQKMKKFTFLVTNNEYEGFINTLRELGVVHIQQLQQGASSDELQQALTLEQRYNQALQSEEIAAKTYSKSMQVPAGISFKPTEPEALLQHIEELQARELQLQHDIDATQKNIEALEPWGEFSQADVKHLSETSNQQICFFRCSGKFFKQEWVDKYFAIPVNDLNKSTYFVTFSEEKPDIQAEQIFLPEGSLSQYGAQLKDLHQQLADLRGELLYINANLRPVLEAGKVQAQNAISLSKVHLSDEKVAGDVLRLLIGWVRADKTDELTAYLDGDKIFYEMEDPAYEDDVPIQITNGKFSKLFEPILKMYSLPNYTDLDPTTFFAPFFALFFGLCLGDAGYGALVLCVGIWLALKGSEGTKPYGRLAIWLGLATIFCGLATGTVFGVDLNNMPWSWLDPVRPYFLSDKGIGPLFGYTPMMVISVIIGLVQVLLGMILKGCKAIKNYGWPYAVGTFSWVVAILGAVCLYGLPACGVVLPIAVQYILLGIIGIAALGIFFYNNPASYKRPVLGLLGNIGGGVWSTYGMATGLLGDLLSYIRLFALGLTGGVLGGVFNSLAFDMTTSLPLAARIPVIVLILLAGHGITFALSMISAFVHPMRLTFVEFFKNADFSGGGKAYEPFREIK